MGDSAVSRGRGTVSKSISGMHEYIFKFLNDILLVRAMERGKGPGSIKTESIDKGILHLVKDINL